MANAKDVIITKAARKVSNLSISRNGNVFTANWTNTASYSVLKVKWRRKYKGAWKEWHNYVNCASTGDNARQFATIDFTEYAPFAADDGRLEALEVCVACDQATETVQKTNKKKKKYKQITKYTTQTASYVYEVLYPQIPTIEVADGYDDTTFTATIPYSNTDERNIITKIEWQTKVLQDWGDKDPATNNDWDTADVVTSNIGRFDTDTQTFSKTFGASHITNTSYTVLARVKARGPRGTHNYYAYAMMVYAHPYAAQNVKAEHVIRVGNGYRVIVTWKRVEDGAHPAEKYKAQYFIGKPKNANNDIPDNASWIDATNDYIYARSGVDQATSFDTNGVIDDEECLWVRIVQHHVQNLATPSEAVLAWPHYNVLAPSIESVSYNAVTHALTVSTDKNSELADTKTWVYVGYSPFEVPASGTLSITYELDISNWSIRARNWHGTKASDFVGMKFDPSRDADNPLPYAPTNVKAEKSTAAGNVIITWVPVLKGVTSSRITVADNANEWSKANPSFVKDVTVDGAGTYATIGNLTLDRTYYFKVQSTNAHGTTDYSANTASLFLESSRPPVPNMSALETADHDIRVWWDWDLWEDATQVQLTWSTNKNDGSSNRLSPTIIEKEVSTGTQIFYIAAEDLERGKTWYIWARYVADEAVSRACMAQVLLPITPIAPTIQALAREQQVTDEEGETSVRISWSNNWKDAVKTELSWAMSDKAWDATSGKETYELDVNETTMLLTGLELGKTWYARVKSIYNDEFYAESNLMSVDLRTTPNKPVADVAKTIVSKKNKVDISWSYSNDDLSEQKSAVVSIYNNSGTVVKKVSISSSDKAVSISASQLTANARYYATVRTVSANDKQSPESNPVYFTIISVPTASITSTSLVNQTISGKTVKALTSLPLTMTIGGAPSNGSVIAYIERTITKQLDRPDESTEFGYAGELIAVKEGNSGGVITIRQTDLHIDFTDMGEYRIIAYALNELGERSKPKTQLFTVKWTHQALMPIVDYEIDDEHNIAEITVTAPSGTANTDTFDIYRLSADKPQLILRDGTWGTTYVDPYPAFGDDSGHRVVFRTQNGDYTTASGRLAWKDCFPPYGTDQPSLESDTAIIDFGTEQVEIEYNLDVSHTFSKDFTETKYLGGSIQGDWNPAVSRKTSIGGLMIKLVDASDILKMRRLAQYAGICHVRTPDGSSFAADVEVSESWSSDKQFEIAEFSLEIIRVDSEVLDGIPLTEWEASNGLE